MKNINKIIDWYYHFFDKKIFDSTFVVWIIGILMILVWFLSPANWFEQSNVLKWNILESSKKDNENIVIIWWKKYRLILEEVK